MSVPSGAKLTALFVAQLVMCGLWAVGAWFYFRKQPIEACEQRGAALQRESSALAAREALRAAEVWLLRGDYAAALEQLPRARNFARQAGYALDLDFDDVDQMLCAEDQLARDRLALLASRLLQSDPERRGSAVAICPPPSQPRVAARVSERAPAAERAAAPPAERPPAPPPEKAQKAEGAAAKLRPAAPGGDEDGGRRRRHRTRKSKKRQP